MPGGLVVRKHEPNRFGAAFRIRNGQRLAVEVPPAPSDMNPEQAGCAVELKVVAAQIH
jgi:hypothetical protein